MIISNFTLYLIFPLFIFCCVFFFFFILKAILTVSKTIDKYFTLISHIYYPFCVWGLKYSEENKKFDYPNHDSQTKVYTMPAVLCIGATLNYRSVRGH